MNKIRQIHFQHRVIACIHGVYWIVLLIASSVYGAATPVREGKIAATVVVSETFFDGWENLHPAHHHFRDTPWIETVINEWRDHLGLLGEGELAVERLGPDAIAKSADVAIEAGHTVLVLACPMTDPSGAERLRNADADPESFLLTVGDQRIQITGLTPKGVLNGVYEVLEQLGFRWYMPGEFGRVIPPGTTFEIAAQDALHIPSFNVRSRLIGAADPWLFRMRCSAYHWPVGHGIRPFFGRNRRRYLETNPEWFALVNGERRHTQMCLSHPEVLDYVVAHLRETLPDLEPNPHGVRTVGMTPNDGGNFCQCDGCRALDPPANAMLQTPRPSMTDRYIWFINQVLERVGDEFPDLRIGFLPYAAVMEPPVKVTPDPRIYALIAEIHVCRIHGPGNPHCPESNYLTWLMREWGKLLPVVHNSGYYFNLACPGFPFMMMHRMRDEIPLLHQLGSHGITRGIGNAYWATHGPSSYLAAKLNWNGDTDVDALLDEFFHAFYGPAADPMRDYTMLIDRALYTADQHSGSSWDLIHIYDESVREAARAALQRAEEQVDALEDGSRYALRVDVAAKGWAYFEAFARMLESRRQHDFVAAMAALEETREIGRQLAEDYEYPMLRTQPGSVSYRRFLDLFFGADTEAGYERVTGENRLLAGLSPEWEFLMEPQGIGERIGLQDPANIGGNWGTIDTRHTWSNHGLRYYYGEAWYRQRLHVPAPPPDRRVMLWFSGVDRGARVWLNGHLLGTSPGTEFDIDAHGGVTRPFEFDATDLIRPGTENTVTVRTIRDISNELGTGGLRDTAMFYMSPEQSE